MGPNKKLLLYREYLFIGLFSNNCTEQNNSGKKTNKKLIWFQTSSLKKSHLKCSSPLEKKKNTIDTGSFQRKNFSINWLVRTWNYNCKVTENQIQFLP